MLLVLHLPAAAQGDDMERRLKDLPEWVLSVTNNLLLHRSWRQGASGRCGARPGFLCVQETTAQQHIANKTYQLPILMDSVDVRGLKQGPVRLATAHLPPVDEPQ